MAHSLTSRLLRATLMVGLLVAGVLSVPGEAQAPAGSAIASQRYQWGPSLYDFAWEFGESLTSPPARGTRKRGKWIDASDGTGRAFHYNGGMQLESQLKRGGGPGDIGTTSVTLRDNAQAYGRWEFRMRSRAEESNAVPFRIRIQLIPDKPGTYDCKAANITVADFAVGSSSLGIGVNAKGSNSAWTYSKKTGKLGDDAHAFAVEVARDHISWFLDGVTIGTVKDRKAISGLALTPHLSLVGNGTNEMNHTIAIYDWMRAWPIKLGAHPKNGHSLNKGTRKPC